MDESPIHVTKSFLPPWDKYELYAKQVFESAHLTNRGPFCQQLTKELKKYLNLDFLHPVSNGTLALMLAIRQAGLGGKKVVTTPFSYVATVSSLLWEGCTPVFADIDQDTLCLSPKSILETLQRHPDAAGIMPVHVYGNACAIEEIERICSDHSLVCIYDAAHAFGARYKGRSLLDYGDYAVCSFHATKLFHTVEGGCIVSHSEEQEHAIELLHAFGHIGDQHYSLGINGKLSELHAAMGLAVLPYIGEIMQSRSEVFGYYEEFLPKEGVARPTLQDGLQYNYAYFPVLFSSEAELLLIKSALEEANIFPRRYFYPSLTTLPYLPEISKKCLCPIADSIAPRVLSLPLYPGLQKGDVQRIAEILARNIR